MNDIVCVCVAVPFYLMSALVADGAVLCVLYIIGSWARPRVPGYITVISSSISHPWIVYDIFDAALNFFFFDAEEADCR